MCGSFRTLRQGCDSVRDQPSSAVGIPVSRELLRELRARVDEAIRPHRDIYGPDAPVVKMALRILAEAEDIERALSEQRLSTAEASERTRWRPETLQKYARMKLAGEPLPPEWAGLIVEKVGGDYTFVVGSIPEKRAAA